MILADWLERLGETEALEMSRILRASFGTDELVRPLSNMKPQLGALLGARRGWFCGSWKGNVEMLWLASPFCVELPSGVPLELEWVPAGTFLMGSPDSEEGRHEEEETQRQVTITKGYYMSKYPVTVGQWHALMGKQPWYVNDQSAFRKYCQTPIVGAWKLSIQFCQKFKDITGMEIRLPTDAEWEYACRAGRTSTFCCGDDEIQLGDYCWFIENSNKIIHPVGDKLPNDWNLYDMPGNVWEWVADCWHTYSSEAVTDPRGPEINYRFQGTDIGRLTRGGDFESSSDDCRSARRNWYDHAYIGTHIGFRIVLEIPTND